MKENCPSQTALGVAMRRAAHQVLDDPKVFDDPLALRVLYGENTSALQQDLKWSDETLYHPPTKFWTPTRLQEAAIPIPRTLTFTPIDFETQTLEEGLRLAGFDSGKCTFFSWLGVTQYLTSSAITATLRFIASMRVGSGIVFDYMILPSLLDPTARRAFDALAYRVALAGEPFRTFFDPSSLKSSLRSMGFGQIEDIEPEEMNERYFQGRADSLRVGNLAHIMNARV
jgi:O-methyltransferase involved in polyketide biosynthesis